jgi:hypothetical protein
MNANNSNSMILDANGRPIDDRPGRSRFSLFGIFLIVFGLLLAAGELTRQADVVSSAFFFAVGVVLVAAGARERSDLLLYAGVLVTGLALAGLITAPSVNIVHGEGWGSLFVGIGVAAVAGLRWLSSRKGMLAFALGLLLAFWGGSEVLQTYSSFPANGLIGPIVLVLIGLYVVTRRARIRMS